MNDLLTQFDALIFELTSGKPTCNKRNACQALVLFKSGPIL